MSQISNVIGVELPKHITSQLETRSKKNSVEKNRTNDDLLFAANKTAWIRVVSSVDISNEDIEYFKNYVEQQDQYNSLLTYDVDYDIGYGISYTDPSFLAKKFVLFGGSSKYDNVNKKYNLRSGLNGAYAPLGENEINAYGYRPMPGITSAVIDTAGRMGSIRYATISFKVWDKMQLDIIDALYFKLGYSMFIEWGQTYFYKSDDIKLEVNEPSLYSSEDFSVNPFSTNWSKEALNLAIARASEQTQGNYDGMLGTCTNFNFSMNQEGGYDCTIKVIGLGFLADSIKINQHGALVDVLKLEIKRAVDYRNKVEEEKAKLEKAKNDQAAKEKVVEDFNVNNLLGYLLYSYQVKNSNANPIRPYTTDDIKNGRISFENEQLGTTQLGQFKTNSAIVDLNNFIQDSNKKLVIYPSNYQFINDRRNYYQRDYIIDNTKAVVGRLGVIVKSEDKYDAKLNVPYLNSQIRFDINNTGSAQNLGALDSSTNRLTSNIVPSGTIVNFNYENVRSDTGNAPGARPVIESGTSKGISLNYKKNLVIDNKKITNNFYLNINLGPKKSNLQLGDVLLNPEKLTDVDQLYAETVLSKLIQGTFDFGNLKLIGIFTNSTSGNIEYKLTTSKNLVLTDILFDRETLVEKQIPGGIETVKENVRINLEYTFDNIVITTNDSSLFSEITPDNEINKLDNLQEFEEALKNQDTQSLTNNEDLSPDLDVKDVQKEELSKYRSGLEIALRAIQLHSLNNVFDSHSDGILEDVLRVDLLKPQSSTSNSSSIRNSLAGLIFTSNGIFKNVFEDIVKDGEDLNIKKYIQDTNGNNNYTSPNFDKKLRMAINAKYGFSNSLMSMTNGDESKNIVENLLPVDYKKLLNAFVIPYIIDNSYIGGGENSVQINHPVYINLGTLIAIINNMCTLYETETEKIGSKDIITPLVYIDFNPEINFCLSNPQQISTNPLQFIVPCYASKQQIEELFDKKIIQSIRNDKDSNFEVFDPSIHDKLSGDIYKHSPFKDIGNNAKDTYKGKIANVLISIDYLLQTIKTFSTNDGNGSVYLRAFLERIIFDMNKSLGSFNILRLAYNDKSNVLHIIDDQFVPSSKDDQASQTSEFTMPLYGKNSIARSLEMRTEISSKLGSMIAIASNPTSELQNAISQDVTSFGFINQNYKDRYIKYKQDATIDKRTDEQVKKDNEKKAAEAAAILEQDKTSAIRFNSIIKSFFGTGESGRISVDDINFATNYYIDRMSVAKTKSKATRASVLIPLSLNFTTDGISGINMYNSFSVSEDILPYTYSIRSAVNFGYEKDYLKKVGFCVIGLTHKLENNSWTTDVRSQMIYVKNNLDYVEFVKETVNDRKWPKTSRASEEPINIPYSLVENTKKAVEFFKSKGYKSYQVSAIVGALLAESDLNPRIENRKGGAYGIAQWLTPSRRNGLFKKPNYDTLEVQLEYVIEEFNSNEREAGNAIKSSRNLEEAIAAMASYERYGGITTKRPVTYQDVLDAFETGNRIRYSKTIYKDYFNNI